MQYVQDNNQTYPSGVLLSVDPPAPTGLGWAGSSQSYIKNDELFHCPDDNTSPTTQNGVEVGVPVSYAFNSDVAGAALQDFVASSHTILLFEVTGITAQVNDVSEGTQGYTVAPPTGFMSMFGNGADVMPSNITGFHRQPNGQTVLQIGSLSNPTDKYDTGALGGRWTPNASPDQKPVWFAAQIGRHTDGSNFLLADGHAKFMLPSKVSGGNAATASDCHQGNQANQPADCNGSQSDDAAGTADSQFAATFSPT